MNITLRKANALQISINDAVKTVDIKTEITINEFQNPEHEIAVAAAKIKSEITRRDSLTNALYEIRKAVGTANHIAGIDGRLADIAHLEKQIQNFAALTGKEVSENMDVIKGKLEKIRARPADARSVYGYSDSVSTSVLTAEDITAFKALAAQAKKAKQKLQDEVLELNIRTEITLSASTLQTLTQEGLV
jgi:hypothetical protein